MDFIASLDIVRWIALVFAAVLTGLTKAGLEGGTLIAVPILATLFGARASSGVLLGILMTADVVAVWNYRKDVSVKHLARTLPFAMAGILLGALVGGSIPDRVFRTVMASFILISAVLMAIRELRGGLFLLPEKWWASAPLGLLGGFSSMVGNAGGPIMGLYLLSSGLGKGKLVGTSVYLFFLFNLTKLPFHIFAWKTFTTGTLMADLIVLPVTLAATFIGVRLVRRIPEKPYRVFLIGMAGVAGLYLGLK